MIPSERVTLVILFADSSHGLEPVPLIKSIISPVPVKDSVVFVESRAHLIVPNVPEVIAPHSSNAHIFKTVKVLSVFTVSNAVQPSNAILLIERIFSRILTDFKDTQSVKVHIPE